MFDGDIFDVIHGQNRQFKYFIIIVVILFHQLQNGFMTKTLIKIRKHAKVTSIIW